MLLMTAIPVLAVNPDEILADPALESRARAISEGLRCLVCQNQSIDDSDADLAHELRVIVRERLTAGDTDRQVTDYIVARYGEFVLLQPVLAPHTILLWVAPPLVLIGGLTAIAFALRRRKRPEATPLSAEEQRALSDLLPPT
jgi:cytochrome c-type biogenesis protein CcmH